MATAIIGTLKHLPKASILPTLPETGRPNRIYFIPRGKHEIGFKELSWNKKTLDEFIRRSKHEK